MDPDDCTHPAPVPHGDQWACAACGSVFNRIELPEPSPPRHPGPLRRAKLDEAKDAALVEARAAVRAAQQRATGKNP